MIQPSALPAAGSPLLALDAQIAPQGEMASQAAITTQFADFLAKKLGLGPAKPVAEAPPAAEPTPPANPVAALRAALSRALGVPSHPASGKEAGKPGGKDLPDLPEAVSKSLVAQSEDRAPDDATAAMPAAAEAAPGAATPAGGSPATQIAQTDPATIVPEGQPIAALVAALPRDQPSSARNETVATAATKPAPVPPNLASASAAAEALHRKEPEAGPKSAQAARAIPAHATAAERLARPAIALRTLAQLSEALSNAAPVAAPPFAPAPQAPFAGEAAIAAAAQADTAASGSLPAQAILAKLAFAGSQAEPISPNRIGDAEPAEAGAASQEAAPKPSGKSPVPEAMSLLPAPQPLSAWSAAGPQLPSPVTLATATAAPAALSPPQPRDFAGLIDRLVEAREAAQSTLAPQTVQAALAHADFGKVSLQFQHDVAGMTVAMASADPDFARAVQAAAPAAQTANDTATPQRQDSQGQSSANAGFAHSQSQQRGQSPARDSAEPRPSANPSPSRRDGDEPSTRSGIFA